MLSEGGMGVAKGVALFGLFFMGLGLFAIVFYQSGLLQKMQKRNDVLALKVSTDIVANVPKSAPAGKSIAPLSNPNGDTAIAIIQHYRPLEDEILQALDQGAFKGGF